MFKKLLNLYLILSIVLLGFSKTSFIYAEDEDYEQEEEVEVVEEEKSDRDKCVQDKNEEACIAVARNAKNDLANIEAEIKEAQNDKEAAAKLAQDYKQQAADLQVEIDDLEAQINELVLRIEFLQQQIAENEQKVSELNERVKNRMVSYQSTMHFNGYLEFILGSKSFTDMLRRIYGVEAVVSKDKSDREELIAIITQLNADKEELDNAKIKLDESYDELVNKQAELIKMKEYYEEKEAEIQIELDEMTAERDNYYESFDDLRDVLKEIGYTISDGFVTCVHNARIGSGVWNYSPDFLNGRWHLGVDYSTSRYAEIHAPADGVIIRAAMGCQDPGYLGSACGEWISGGGNQVYMMCEVQGKVYGFIFFHFNTIYVEKGDYLFQDEVIGLVGSSGSSTGPHAHIEMYYLGDGTLSEFLAMNWNATFSVGRGATAYSNRCDVSDAPCILDPRKYLPEG